MQSPRNKLQKDNYQMKYLKLELGYCLVIVSWLLVIEISTVYTTQTTKGLNIGTVLPCALVHFLKFSKGNAHRHGEFGSGTF